jgi:hypothetical protein
MVQVTAKESFLFVANRNMPLMGMFKMYFIGENFWFKKKKKRWQLK